MPRKVEWKRIDQENDHINVQMELVDIPMYHSEERSPLTDISSKISFQRNTMRGKRCRKWKKVEGKKDVPSGKGETSMSHAASSGVKRVWSLRDKADDENLSLEEIAKRLRREINNYSSNKEVGGIQT